MKKALFTISLCLLACLCFSFTTHDETGKETPSNDKERLIVERLFDSQNLQFRKDLNPTRFSFRVMPEDSLRFDCGDCYKYLKPEKNGNSALSISIVSEDGVQQLTASDFENGWLKANTSNGKFTLAIEHGGAGEKNLLVRNLRMWRKTKESSARK